MMFRCCECGNLFEEGEQAVWYENQGECHGVTAMERFSGCPICHEDYEEVHQCKECGDWHADDELYGGWCEKCLRESINYDTFFEYVTETNQFLSFMFETVWDSSEPEKASESLVAAVTEIYKRMKANDLLCDRHEFISICRKYIMEDDGEYGRTDYAEWLNGKREVK